MDNPDNEPQKITAQGIIEYALDLIKDLNAPHAKILSLLAETNSLLINYLFPLIRKQKPPFLKTT